MPITRAMVMLRGVPSRGDAQARPSNVIPMADVCLGRAREGGATCSGLGAAAGDRALHVAQRAVHMADILVAVAAGAAAFEHVARLGHHCGMAAKSSTLLVLRRL